MKRCAIIGLQKFFLVIIMNRVANINASLSSWFQFELILEIIKQYLDKAYIVMAFDITILRFVYLILVCLLCFAQHVLTQVLEEAGYTKESFLVMSDFVKVPLPLYMIFLVFQHLNSFFLF